MSNKYEGIYPPVDYANPNWSKAERVHEWKNYISEPLESIWMSFTDEQKAVIADNAQSIADREEWD